MSEIINPSEYLYIKTSTITGAGRGVFAKEPISAGVIIEQCPVIALQDPKSRTCLRKTELVNYYFLWNKDQPRPALCLGWGSIYNHSFTPNAQYVQHMEYERMDFCALRDIAVGEEITVNYNGDPDDRTPLRVPGIPVEEGGSKKSQLPWVLDAILRRYQLLKQWFIKS